VYIAAATALTRVLPVLLAEYGSDDSNLSNENLKGALGQLTQMSRMIDEQGKSSPSIWYQDIDWLSF
jgi:hypothetical protein